MFRKRLLAFSVLVPLMTISSMAIAGIGISNKRYWPNEVGPNAYRTDRTQDDWNSRRAHERRAPRPQAAPDVHSRPDRCRYLGGAHSPVIC